MHTLSPSSLSHSLLCRPFTLILFSIFIKIHSTGKGSLHTIKESAAIQVHWQTLLCCLKTATNPSADIEGFIEQMGKPALLAHNSRLITQLLVLLTESKMQYCYPVCAKSVCVLCVLYLAKKEKTCKFRNYILNVQHLLFFLAKQEANLQENNKSDT